MTVVGDANGVKKIRRKLDGVLLLDKPIGMSSNQALQAARRVFNAQKAGHTGTLDPLATGLLPLCFGEATKFAGELLDADKTYIATLQLGITTDTGDAEGREITRRTVSATQSEVAAAIAHFQGEIEQIPPMYSALKRDGKPLYEYARAGIEVARAPRKITIHKIEMLECRDEQVSIEVTCSKGTYIRTLAVDIGERLGCGAHLIALRRTVTGGMSVASAITLDALQAMPEPEREAALLPADALIAYLPAFQLDDDAEARLKHGQAFMPPIADRDGSGVGVSQGTALRLQSGSAVQSRDSTPAPTDELADSRVRLYGGGKFLGLGTLTGDGWCKPLRLVASN